MVNRVDDDDEEDDDWPRKSSATTYPAQEPEKLPSPGGGLPLFQFKGVRQSSQAYPEGPVSSIHSAAKSSLAEPSGNSLAGDIDMERTNELSREQKIWEAVKRKKRENSNKKGLVLDSKTGPGIGQSDQVSPSTQTPSGAKQYTPFGFDRSTPFRGR